MTVTTTHSPPAPAEVQPRARDWPHPYEAALAICSDLDETPDRRVYWDIARFLNTDQWTAMGPGVALEVGNSIYFDMPAGQFAYWTTDDAGRAMVRDLIASGHIDVLHSYGDLACRRADAERNLAELDRHGCRLEVWVDHSKAPSNFGPDIMVGSGDVPSSPVYHADLTVAYGIRYVWRGRTTGLIGQDTPVGLRSFAGLWSSRRPLASARTATKEAAKVLLGRRAHPRWEMYADNHVCRPHRLRDGQRVWEFLRANPFWGGSGLGDTPDGLPEVLRPEVLETLLHRRGACILYTHLGKVRHSHCPFKPETVGAFGRVAELYRAGRLWVATTHRLLRYVTARDGLSVAIARVGETAKVTIEGVHDPVAGFRPAGREELQGITLELPRCRDVEVRLGSQQWIPVEVVQRGERTLVVIPWKPLSFPEDARW